MEVYVQIKEQIYINKKCAQNIRKISSYTQFTHTISIDLLPDCQNYGPIRIMVYQNSNVCLFFHTMLITRKCLAKNVHVSMIQSCGVMHSPASNAVRPPGRRKQDLYLPTCSGTYAMEVKVKFVLLAEGIVLNNTSLIYPYTRCATTYLKSYFITWDCLTSFKVKEFFSKPILT